MRTGIRDATIRWAGAVLSGLCWACGASVALGADWKNGDQAVVVEDEIELGYRDKAEAKLVRGQRMRVTEVRDPWIGGEAEPGGMKKFGWVHKRQIKVYVEPLKEVPPAAGKAAARKVLEDLGAELELDGDEDGEDAGVLADPRVGDDAVGVDHEDGALGDALHAEGEVLAVDVVGAGGGLVEVRQERKRRLGLGGELLERPRGVDADGEGLRVEGLVGGVVLGDGAHLAGAHAGEGGGEEEQHDLLAAQRRQRDRLAGLGGEGEVRGLGSDRECHEGV